MTKHPKFCGQCGARLADPPPAACPACGKRPVARETDPHFHRFYRTYHRRALYLFCVALPVGIVMKLPVVWGLAALGIVVVGFRLLRCRSLEAKRFSNPGGRTAPALLKRDQT